MSAGTSKGKIDPERLKGRIPGDAAEFLDGPGLSYTGKVPVTKLKDGRTIDMNRPAPDVFGEDGEPPTAKPPSKSLDSKRSK